MFLLALAGIFIILDTSVFIFFVGGGDVIEEIVESLGFESTHTMKCFLQIEEPSVPDSDRTLFNAQPG